MGFIEWFKMLFSGSKTTTHSPELTAVITLPIKSFPKARGYVVHTAEGGRLECVSQYIVAETLESLYNKGIRRQDVKYALSHKNGILLKNKQYIATIKYKKEK